MRHHTPFSASGTGTFPGHRFLFISDDGKSNSDPAENGTILKTMIIGQYPENVYYYDPYHVENDPVQTEQNVNTSLSVKDREKYYNWVRTISFNQQYLQFTGRSYLANYLRPPPIHFMWYVIDLLLVIFVWQYNRKFFRKNFAPLLVIKVE
jgi:hypothetical protein